MITIIVPVQNDLRITKLIDSLFQAKLLECQETFRLVFSLNKASKKIEILTKDLAQKFPNLIQVVKSQESGISVAKNLAIKTYFKETDYFGFIDSDCIVNPDYLFVLQKYLLSNKYQVVRGKVNFIPLKGNTLSNLNCKLRNASYFLNQKALLSPNLILSKEVFQKAGVYDPRIKYGDDLEFGQRTKSFDLKSIYAQDLLVNHYDDRSFWGKTLKTMWGYGQDRGFRLTRLLRLHHHSFCDVVSLIIGFQAYWQPRVIAEIIFCLGYLIISRISTTISILNLRKKPNSHFFEHPTLTGQNQIITSLPINKELP